MDASEFTTLDEIGEDDEAVKEETTYYDVKPLAQQLIDKSPGFPLVGLQYVLEVQKNVKNVEHCSYICSLCSKKMSSDTLIAHVKSVPHRLKFASFHAMDLHSTYGSLELKQWTGALVKEFTTALQKLESESGRKQMAVCSEKTVPSAITYLKNCASEALAKLKDENRNLSKKESVDISSVVASIMELPKKSVKDIDHIFPLKGNKEKCRGSPSIPVDISHSPNKKTDKRPQIERSPNRQSGNRHKSPVSRSGQRSPVSRRRTRSPVPSRNPWTDRRYLKQSKTTNSPVPSRKSRSPISPRSQRQKRPRSPFSRRLSRSPLLRRQSRSPPRKRSRSPRESFARGRSPVVHKRGPIPAKRANSPSWTHSPVFGRRSISPRHFKRSRSPVSSSRNDYHRMKKSRMTRSPDRREESSMLTSDDMKKIKEFKAEENELKLDHFASLESYLGEPQSHPKYKVEWNIFWERRSQDLRRQGIAPSTYDFTSEWAEFWRQKLTVLCEDEFNERQTKLLLRYNFEKRVMMFLHDNKEVDQLMIKCNETDSSEFSRSSGRSKRSPSPWEVSLAGPSNERRVYESEFTVFGTLKLLNELEDQLGSLGDSIALLFGQTKDLLNKSENPVSLFDDKDNKVLLKLSIGKLSSLVASGVLDTMSQAKTHMAIEHCNWLQKEVEKTFPELPSFIAGLNISTIAQSTLGMGHVQIAAYIAKQLMHIGNTNATETDLNSILNAVSTYHNKINTDNMLKEAIFSTTATSSQFNPVNQISGNGFEVRPALFPSGTNDHHLTKEPEIINIEPVSAPQSAETPKDVQGDKKDEESSGALSLLMSSYEDNIRTIDELTLEELQERLMNFSSLTSNEQLELTDHLKKLEATDSKKVTKLRTMMRQSMKPKKTVERNAKPNSTSSQPPKPAREEKPPPVSSSGDDSSNQSRNLSNTTSMSVEAPYSRQPTSNIYNKPPDSYSMLTPHQMRGINEVITNKPENISHHAEFDRREKYEEPVYQSDDGHFDSQNSGNGPPMMSDSSTFHLRRDYSPGPPNKMQPMSKASMPQDTGYRSYSPDIPHQAPYSGMRPSIGAPQNQSRPRGSWSMRGTQGNGPRQSGQEFRQRSSSFAPRPRTPFPNRQRFPATRGRFDSPRISYNRFNRPRHLWP